MLNKCTFYYVSRFPSLNIIKVIKNIVMTDAFLTMDDSSDWHLISLALPSANSLTDSFHFVGVCAGAALNFPPKDRSLNCVTSLITLSDNLWPPECCYFNLKWDQQHWNSLFLCLRRWCLSCLPNLHAEWHVGVLRPPLALFLFPSFCVGSDRHTDNYV